jgi:hypothetical protein
VDVNTPVPFTVTVPYTAGSSSTTANVTLVITYQDSFGRNLTYVTSMPTTLLSAAQLSQSAGSVSSDHPAVRTTGGLFLLTLIVVIVVIVVAVVAVRRRSSGKKGKKSNVI